DAQIVGAIFFGQAARVKGEVIATENVGAWMPQAGAKCLIDGDEPAFAVLEEHALREVIEKSLFRRRGCGRGDDGWHETIPLGKTRKSWRTNACGWEGGSRGGDSVRVIPTRRRQGHRQG